MTFYCDDDCSLTNFVANEPWCMTHERPYRLQLWKIEISGDTADNSFGNLFSDELFMVTERVSTIVTYARMSIKSAVELNNRDDFNVSAARDDWSI